MRLLAKKRLSSKATFGKLLSSRFNCNAVDFVVNVATVVLVNAVSFERPAQCSGWRIFEKHVDIAILVSRRESWNLEIQNNLTIWL